LSCQNLAAPCQICQPCGGVNGIAKAVAIDLDHFTGFNTDLYLHGAANAARIQRLVKQLFLNLHAGRQRNTLSIKRYEQTIVQQLSDAAVVLIKHLALSPTQLINKDGRRSIAKPFIQAGAANKISKNNGGHGAA